MSGEPRRQAILDPEQWATRHTLAAVVAGIVVTAVVVIDAGGSRNPADSVRTLVAALVGCAMIALGLTFRGTEPGGFVIGLVVAAGTAAEFSSSTTVFVLVSAAGGLVFLAFARSPTNVLAVARSGTAWMRSAFWAIGALGALLMWRLEVGLTRGLYAAFNIAIAAAVFGIVDRKRADPSIGIAGAFLVLLGVVFLDGSGNALDALHPVPAGTFGPPLQDRFWGGPHVAYGPNSMGMVALLVAIRIGADRSFRPWKRLATVGVAGFVMVLTDSRTVLVCAGASGLVYAWMAVRRLSGHDLERRLLAASVPLVVLVTIFAWAGGSRFAVGAAGDASSGRIATWTVVLEEFRSASLIEKLLGQTDTTRGTLTRPDPTFGKRPTPTDNAALGSLHRAGIAGACAFLFGLGLLIARTIAALRVRSGGGVLDWFPVAVLGTLPTIVAADWYLGTVGHLSTMLLAGEVGVLSALRGGRSPHENNGQ